MVSSSSSDNGGSHFRARSLYASLALSQTPSFLRILPAKWLMVLLRLPSRIGPEEAGAPKSSSSSLFGTRASSSTASSMVIQPSFQISSSSLQAEPKKNLAASLALSSKNGYSLWMAALSSSYLFLSVKTGGGK